MKKITKIVYASLIVFVIIVVAFLINNISNKNKNIFGFKSYIILSDSMKPSFKAGDLIIVRKVDTDVLKVDDIISYSSRDPRTFGDVITHRIISIDPINNEFQTQGDNSETPDEYKVSGELILGRYVLMVPLVGYFLSFLQTTTGFVLLFIAPLSLLIITEFVHIVKMLHKYKSLDQEEELEKKNEELEAYKSQLEALNKKLEEKESLNSQNEDVS